MGGAHGRKRRWIMRNFIQRSFRRELLVSFLAVSVLPLIVCCVFLIQMFKVKVGRDFEKKDMELAGAVEHQLMTLLDRKSTRLNSSHPPESRMPSSA